MKNIYVEEEFININGNWVHRTAIVNTNVIMGKGNRIGAYSVIGSNGQIRNTDPNNFKGKVVIGNNNVISEMVTIQTSYEDGKVTKIGNNNIIMAHAHIGHNVEIGNDCEICSHCAISGYSKICDGVKIKVGSLIRNRIKVGKNSVVGMGSVVVKDVEEGVVVVGNPVKKLKKC